MIRKARRGRHTSVVTTDRTRTFTVGALIASAALGSLATGASAAEPSDARLRVIDTVLKSPRAAHAAAFLADDAAGQTPTVTVSVPAGPLQTVVAVLERTFSVRIAFSHTSLGELQSPGVSGSVSLEQALRAVLAGTGADFRGTSASSFVIDLAALSESVSVTGAVAAVASPKYNAPLREIPQTIEVIPRAAMDAQGITSLTEALRNVPGITMQAGEGGGASSTAGDMFNMRGFSASNSLFVDNVRDDGLVSRDIYNLEQVEVFMGPTGSDVGRGTAAGYINQQSKTPHLPAATSATLQAGSAAQRRATFDINQPLSKNQDSWVSKSAVRLNAMWQDSGVPGRDEVQNESRAFAPSLALGLSTPTRVMASAQVLRQDNIPDYGAPAAAWNGEDLRTDPALIVKSLGPVAQTNFYGSPGVDFDRASQTTITARVERDLAPGWTVSNQTRHNRAEREALITSLGAFTPDTQTVALARQANFRENQITSNQTALSGRAVTGALSHSITSGVEFAREAQFSPTMTGTGTRGPVDIYNPNPSDPVLNVNLTPTGAFTDGSTGTVAGYLFDTVSFGPRLKLNGGMRVERYNTESTSLAIDATTGARTTTDLAGDGTLVSGKAGVVVQLVRNTNAYVSYGTTLQPPGSANFGLSATANNQNNPNVDPQKATNTEVGLKSDLADGRLSLNAAYFHTINENVIFTIPGTTPPEFNQDDKQRVDGLTLGATGQVNRNWNVLANFSYLDSESLTQNATNNGRRIQLTPKFSGSLWTTYRLPRNFTVGGGVRTIGDVFVNAVNTIVGPGYTLVDTLASYTLSPKLTLQMNVNNLLDQEYIRNVNNNGGRYNPGYARTVQLTLAAKF